MWRYIVAHWQGRQSLSRSVFLNGLLVYLLIVAAAGFAEAFSVRGGAPLVWLFLGAMLAWLVWAIVGILRCGWRILADPGASLPRKLGAIAAILGATAFALVSATDLFHIFFVRPAPSGPRVQTAARAVVISAAVISKVDFGKPRLKMTFDDPPRPSRMPAPFVRTARP